MPRSRFICAPSQFYLFACLTFVVLSDLIFMLYTARVFERDYYNDQDLPLANPYIGLQELYASGHVKSKTLDPILNRPHVVTQVYRNEPDRAGRRGEHRMRVAIMGELSPLDKHFVVDNKVRLCYVLPHSMSQSCPTRHIQLSSSAQWTLAWSSAR